MRLANFYRTCGGDFDELFKNTGEHGVSFLYRTLGCYHSLQPTLNAFKAPSIPCLTDDGFVRWQTLQLLLCPDEHANLLQRAVEIYDVPRVSRGGFFPKRIPRECFPPRPDVDMEKWHRFVTSQINQESHIRRLKFSPYQSPQPDVGKSPDGYFERRGPSNLTSKPIGRDAPGSDSRTSDPRRKTSSDEEKLARQEAARRRSSVPDVLSPGGTNYSRDFDDREQARKSRSHSANRHVGHPEKERRRPRSNTGSPAYHQSPLREYRQSQNSPQTRYGSENSLDRPLQRPSKPRHDRDRSSTSRLSTEEDASSEESYPTRKIRSSGEDEKGRRSRWGASLMPSFFLSSNKRRHSSDGRVPTIKENNSRSPRRSDSIRKYATEGPSSRYLNSIPDRHDERSSSGVRFQPNVFDPVDTPRRPPLPSGEAVTSAQPTRPSSHRYSEPQPTYQPPLDIPNPISSGNVDALPPSMSQKTYYPPPASANTSLPRVDSMHNPEARKQGLPVRVSTVSGVNGRKYAPNSAGVMETRSAIEPNLGRTRRGRTGSMRNFQGVASMV